MLLVKAPVWKIAQVLEISESAIRHYYKDVLDQHEIKSGPRPYEPSPEDKARVLAMAVAGIRHVDIAKALPCGINTLYEHYREELDLGLTNVNTRIVNNLALTALGPRTEKTTVTAAIWWTKAVMGWRDTSRIEQTGPDGGPIQTESHVVIVLPDNGRTMIDVNLDDAENERSGESGAELALLPTRKESDDEDA
jgi:transposase-like protein